MELKGTKTEKNLMEAFAGESMARNKYTFFASVARKEGYEQLAAIFEETAGNEKEHAKLWFKALCGGFFSDRRFKMPAALLWAKTAEKLFFIRTIPESLRNLSGQIPSIC